MEKTIREWLEMLPEPYRTEAIENAERLNEDCATEILDTFESSLSFAIKGAFTWRSTTQGLEYWADVWVRARRGEFDTKEPQR